MHRIHEPAQTSGWRPRRQSQVPAQAPGQRLSFRRLSRPERQAHPRPSAGAPVRLQFSPFQRENGKRIRSYPADFLSIFQRRFAPEQLRLSYYSIFPDGFQGFPVLFRKTSPKSRTEKAPVRRKIRTASGKVAYACCSSRLRTGQHNTDAGSRTA